MVVNSRPSPLSSVYDGRICRGFVIARGKLGFEAFDSDERSFGVYPTQGRSGERNPQ